MGSFAHVPANGGSYRRHGRAPIDKEDGMPRYVIERTFTHGVDLATARLGIVETNAALGVTWIHSYVSEDGKRAFCVYDADTPEALRKSAAANELPVEQITQVRVLDPYHYR
jgi:predicted amidohydrolase YtcJ